MSQPLTSVVVPTYHRNDLLALCLDCLAPDVQTLPAADYEVIVTDDGSQITARAMMEEHYSWARWVAGPKRGPAANRNAGAAQARGEWIAFTDDDCLPKPNWLQAFADAIAPEVLVYEGKTTCEAGLKSPLETAPVNLEGGHLWSCNMMLNGRLFGELGGFDEQFPTSHMEDVDLHQRIKKGGHAIKFAADAVIDHPPRRLGSGKKLGAMAESSVLYDAKYREAPPGSGLLRSVWKTRLRAIKSYPYGKDSLLATASLIAEINYIWPRLARWRKRYSRVDKARRNASR